MDMNIGNTFSLKDTYIRDKYKTAKIDFIRGHIKTIGRTSNQEKNPLWKIQNENGTTIIVMYCEVDTLCILCPTSYQKILDYEKTNNKGNKITWYKMSNGYISCRLNIHMHQVITGCMGNGKGTKTDPLFRASDIGIILEINNIRMSIVDFDESEKRAVSSSDSTGRMQDVTFLTEKGLYKVLFRSRKPIAQKFQNWVCEVIKDGVNKKLIMKHTTTNNNNIISI
jgi:hypothetical protein